MDWTLRFPIHVKVNQGIPQGSFCSLDSWETASVGRAGLTIIFYGLLLTTAALAALAFSGFGGSRVAPVTLVALVAFLMIGAYSYLAGAISLDFGGKQGSATASGLIDGFGYRGRSGRK
jgi:sugar phosphate permease